MIPWMTMTYSMLNQVISELYNLHLLVSHSQIQNVTFICLGNYLVNCLLSLSARFPYGFAAENE